MFVFRSDISFHKLISVPTQLSLLHTARARRLTEPNRLVYEPKTENWKFISARFTCIRY